MLCSGCKNEIHVPETAQIEPPSTELAQLDLSPVPDQLDLPDPIAAESMTALDNSSQTTADDALLAYVYEEKHKDYEMLHNE